MKRWKIKRKARKRRAVLTAIAISISMISSVLVTPKKAAAAEAGYLTDFDFAVSALETTLMEALGWAADKTENEGIEDIYKMISIANDGSGTDAIISYCNDIRETFGTIHDAIERMDENLRNLIDSFQNRGKDLAINERYKNMQSATTTCDTIIKTYIDYIDKSKSYALDLQNGNSNGLETSKQEAEEARETLVNSLIRADKDQAGKIDTDAYDTMLRSVNKSTGTKDISFHIGEEDSSFQGRSETFTGLLYESYSLKNNIFDHQHREAIETGMNASVSQFAKILLAYRIQLDYVSAENEDLVEQKKLSQEEADNRMKTYEEKYIDYINAVTNAYNDVGTMYQDELSKMMHTYDEQTSQTMLYNESHNPGTKKTEWYYEDNQVQPAEDTIVEIEEEPGIWRTLKLFTNDSSGFFRGNVNGVSYLISKNSAGLVPEDFVYTAPVEKDGDDYEYKLRSKYFYNFMTTTDGAYRMIQGPDDLSGLISNVPAWNSNTTGFLSYLNENGQLGAKMGSSEESPFDADAGYIVLSEEYKETSPNSKLPDTDGAGTLENSSPHYKFYQNMWMLDTNFDSNSDLSSTKKIYNSKDEDRITGTLLIMKAKEDVTPAYSVSVNEKEASTQASLSLNQVKVSKKSDVPADEQLKIKVTPMTGWIFKELKIKDASNGNVLDTLSGPQTFNFVNEDGSATFLYNMPYRNILAEASFVMGNGGNLDGNGSEEHPYLIKDVKDYQAAVERIGRYTLDAQAHYTVVNDIDFSSHPDTEKTEIEKTFKGVWDGGGHVFRNLGPSKGSKDSAWMQAVGKGGVVKNLTFENIRFINLIAANYGTIDHCANTGDSQADFQGLVRENTGKILNCYNTADIIGDNLSRAGAIVQNNKSGGLVANCWNRGAFKNLQNTDESGGLAATNEGHVYNCYNTGKPDDSGLRQFGALIYNEVSNEQGATIANSFYPESLEQWSQLPLQHYSVGTMLTDEEMHTDDGLLKKLNEGVGKAKTMSETEGAALNYWSRSDEVNDGYPVFADIGDEHSITIESEYGTADIAFLDGTKVEGTAPARMPLALTVTPDKGREIEKITLLKTSGEALADIPVTDRSQDVLTAQFVMPEENCILRVDYYQFIKDKDTYLIGDYPALLSVARAVNASDYFASANFRLTADIKGNNQEWPLPIGTGREYNGTFDGAGFSIARLRFEQDQMDGGIFGTIGEKGTVKNLGVFGFTVKSNLNAGGIAASNKGIIDNCYSGTAQLGEGSYIDEEGEHSLKDLNSSVSAQMTAGGIAAYSTGIIVNSRSGAEVYGVQLAGGIAGQSLGNAEEGDGIINSYVMGSVSSKSTAGGIAGTSGVPVENTYFAGSFKKTPDGITAGFQGSIVGEHSTESLKNCYFLNSTAPENSQTQSLPGMESVTEEVMRSRAFADTLNKGVTKTGYDYWTQKDSQGNGYPYLTHNPYVEQSYTDPETGITVSGIIHAGAILNVKKPGTADEDYQILDKYVNGQKLVAVYDIALNIQGKDNGKKAFKDSLSLLFPIDEKVPASDQWVVHYDGAELHVHKDILSQDGKLALQANTLKTFGIIAAKDADESVWDNHIDKTNNVNNINNVNKAKTGDESSLLFYLILAGAGLLTAAVVIYYKKKTMK